MYRAYLEGMGAEKMKKGRYREIPPLGKGRWNTFLSG